MEKLMQKPSVEELKLRFLGLVKTAAATDTKLNIQAISKELDVPPARLTTWMKAFKEADNDEAVVGLIDVDQLILDKVTAEVEESIKLIIDEESGAVRVENPKSEEVTYHPASKAVGVFRDKVTGLDALNSEVQGTAGILANKILHMANTDPDLSAGDLARLASAITSIQMAFFNKNQTNIQVNTMTPGGTSLLSSFQGNLKS